jgi:hypothetical protein
MVAEQSGTDASPDRRTSRQPRQPGGRKNVVKVLLSDQERERLAGRARVAGVSVQRLLVEAALAGDAQTATERRGLIAEFAGARRLVAQVSNNVNQLARAANATGEIPAELSATMHAATRMIARLEAAMVALTGGQNGAVR